MIPRYNSTALRFLLVGGLSREKPSRLEPEGARSGDQLEAYRQALASWLGR